MEGVVAKRLTSRYVSRRSGTGKARHKAVIDMVVVGWVR